MRMPFITLIPAALITSAAYAQEDTRSAEPMAPEPAQEQAEKDSREGSAPPAVETREVTGTWTRTTDQGRDAATYVSKDGETLFSATCMTADTEFGDRIVVLKAASSEDTTGAIDIFTSAGNARVPAEPDSTPDTAAGMADPVSQPTYVLSAGAGELRIVSGARGMVFETDPMLKSVLRGCHPVYDGTLRSAADTEEADVERDDAEEPADTSS